MLVSTRTAGLASRSWTTNVEREASLARKEARCHRHCLWPMLLHETFEVHLAVAKFVSERADDDAGAFEQMPQHLHGIRGRIEYGHTPIKTVGDAYDGGFGSLGVRSD